MDLEIFLFAVFQMGWSILIFQCQNILFQFVDLELFQFMSLGD